MNFVIENWELISLILTWLFIAAEKYVKLSPSKNDDILMDIVFKFLATVVKRKKL